MASQERLEYFISAAFKDEGVRQAMQAFGKLNAESAKVVNELNRISDAGARAGQKIRDSRTPYAQLGMQVNQLGTQLASGTNFAVAFAQQIGDVGWALQNANGVLGVVGRFLAGPWGAMVAIGATALTPLIDKLFQSKAAAEAARNAHLNFLDAVRQGKRAELVQAESQLTALQERRLKLEIRLDNAEKTKGFNRQYELQQIPKIREELKKLNNEIAWQQQAVDQGNAAMYSETAARDTSVRAIRSHSSAVSGNSAAVDQNALKIKSLVDSIQESINIYTSLDKGTGKAKNKLEEFNQKVDDLSKLKGGAEVVERLKVGIEGVRRGIMDENSNKALEEFIKLTDTLSNKTLPDWKVKLNELSNSYNALTEEQRNNVDNIKRFQTGVEAIVGGPINDAIKKYDDLIAKANGVDDSFEVMRQQFVDSIAAAQQMGRDVSVLNEQLAILDQKHSELKIAERNAEIRKSFESIGMSVNDAFKGMLTAGMSWKDGMKGIINAVIDELWRLFVVQQIVGMVKNVLGGFLGGGGGLKMPSVASQVSASDAVLSNIVSNSQAGAVFIPGTNLIDWSKTFDPIGKNANGTPSWQGGLTWVGERGPELVNLPRGAGVIPAHRASQMGSGGINITVDARGSADPAAVRAQVQQGILEAAPAIVAAAQQRTVAGLRRPKLGGAMQ